MPNDCACYVRSGDASGVVIAMGEKLHTKRPLVLENGREVASGEPGAGVEFDWIKLAPYLVA